MSGIPVIASCPSPVATASRWKASALPPPGGARLGGESLRTPLTKRRRPDDDPAGLDLAPRSHDSLGTATRQRRRAEALVDRLESDAGVREVVLAREDQRHVTGRAAETERRPCGSLRERVDAAVALYEAGGEADRLHASSICWPFAGASGGGPGSWPISSRKRRAESGASLERLLLKATCTSPASSASPCAR